MAPAELLDLATVIKVSQAVSGEMVLEKLIERVMRAAIEHAGAERGLLILPRGDGLQIEAEATTIGIKCWCDGTKRTACRSRVARPLRCAHARAGHPGRCSWPEPICRRSLHCSASRSFGSLLALDYPGQAGRHYLPGKQFDPARFHFRADQRTKGARVAGGDLAGEYATVPRS